MTKLDEVNLKLDGRTLLGRGKQGEACWCFYGYGPCSGKLSPYIAQYSNVLTKEYILGCAGHRKNLYILGWKKYEEE